MLTGQEPNDGREDCDDAIYDRHDDSSDRTDDCHDTVTDPLDTGHYCAHADGVGLRIEDLGGKAGGVVCVEARLVGRDVLDCLGLRDVLQEGLLLTDEL